jgi:hypothetical protein
VYWPVAWWPFARPTVLRLSGLQYCIFIFSRGTDFHGQTIFFYPTLSHAINNKQVEPSLNGVFANKYDVDQEILIISRIFK